MKKCGLYLRVSTQRQADVKEGSLDTQEDRLTSYVNLRNSSDEEWQVLKVYREEGRTAKHTVRPQLGEMISDIKKGLVNTVLCTKINRLSRSLLDFYKLSDLFQKHGIDFITLDENFDTSTPSGRAMLKVFLVFAEHEREQTSERTKEKMKWRAEQGLWNGGQILGFDLDPDEKGILKPNKEEAQLINLIFNIYIEKGSLLKTAQAINDKGYRTKEFYSRRGKFHKGKPFTNTAITRILQNNVYIGKIGYKGTLFQGRHKPLMEEELFEKANELLKSNRVTYTNPKQDFHRTYLLKGLLKCGFCDSAMTPKYSYGNNRKMYFYYQCTGNAHGGKQKCSMKYVPADEIEEKVVEEVKKIAESLDLIEKVVEEANKDGMAKIEEMKGQGRELEKKLPGLGKRIDSCKSWLQTNPPETEEVVEVGKEVMKDLGELLLQRKQINQEIERLGLEIKDFEQKVLNAEVAKDALVKFSELYDLASDEQKATLLQLMISKVIFKPDEIKIGIYGDIDEKAERVEKKEDPDVNPSGGNVALSIARGEPLATRNANFLCLSWFHSSPNSLITLHT